MIVHYLAWLSNDFLIFYNAATIGAANLYTPNAQGFFYTPFSLIILAPFSLIPLLVSQHTFRLALLCALVAIAVTFASGRRRALLAIATPLTVVTLVYSQWEAILLIGALLALAAIEKRSPLLASVSIIILATKPIHAIVLCALLAWEFRRDWRFYALPALALVASFALCGLDWPVRWLAFTNANYYHSTSAHLGIVGFALAPLVVLAIARTQDTDERVALAMACGLLIAPVTSVHHLVLALPLLAVTLRRSPAFGIAALVASWLAVLAFPQGYGVMSQAFLLCVALGGIAPLVMQWRQAGLRREFVA